MNDISEFADWIAGGQFDPEYEYNSKRRELDKLGHRVNKVKTVDVNAEYKVFKEYEKSDVYRNVQRATQLLSREFDITNDQLKSVMKRNYSLRDGEYHSLLEHLSNSKDVNVRIGTFDRVVKLRRR